MTDIIDDDMLGIDYCSTHHVHGLCDECEYDEKGNLGDN
jgi:hypothetical protein